MRLLVYRYSSLGDVALVLPVLRALLDENSSLEITLATHRRFCALFQEIPRLTAHAVDTRTKHQGPLGMLRLAKELLQDEGPFDAFVDLHSVTRSFLLGGFLRFLSPSLPVYRYDKGRAAKQALTRRHNKVFTPLEHTSKRYLKAFEQLGLQMPEKFNRGLPIAPPAGKKPARELKIGIAPLSAHRLKEWPLEKMKSLMKMIGASGVHFYLLGGPGEKEQLNAWQFYPEQTTNVAGAHDSFEAELRFIAGLDLVITMDSANGHIAALLGVPVLSIWGPTHPFAGFSPLQLENAPEVQIAQREDLSCRPCSIYGNRPCYRKDHACMEGLSAEEVYQKFLKIFPKRG